MTAPFENESLVSSNQYPTMATATAKAIRFETISMSTLVMGCIVVTPSSRSWYGLHMNVIRVTASPTAPAVRVERPSRGFTEQRLSASGGREAVYSSCCRFSNGSCRIVR